MSTMPPPASPPADLRPLPQGLTGWMGFVGVMTILAGALNVLTCVGVITGVLMILAGVGVMQARAGLLAYPAAPPHLAAFFQRLKSYFLLTAWVYIVGVVLVGVGVVFYFGALMALLAAAAGRH